MWDLKKLKLILTGISLAPLSSCEVASIHTVHEGAAVTQKDLMETP